MIVEGEFAGSIQCQELVITRRGKIEAWVEVENMEVWGEVNGFSRVKKVICRKTSRIGVALWRRYRFRARGRN